MNRAQTSPLAPIFLAMPAYTGMMHARYVGHYTGMENYRGHPSLRWLVDTLGVDRTYECISRLAYGRVYIPRVGYQSQVLDFLTPKEMSAFQDQWAGQTIKLPTASAFCCQYLAFVRNLSNAAIAREMRIREDSVRRALKGDLGFPVNFSTAAAQWKTRQNADAGLPS